MSLKVAIQTDPEAWLALLAQPAPNIRTFK